MSLAADGLFWPSPSSGICTTGTTGWKGGRAGIPSFFLRFGGVFFVMGGRIRVECNYGTRLNHNSERNAHNLSKNGVTTIFQSAIWSMVLPALEVF
jgi:hypothetical protein